MEIELINKIDTRRSDGAFKKGFSQTKKLVSDGAPFCFFPKEKRDPFCQRQKKVLLCKKVGILKTKIGLDINSKLREFRKRGNSKQIFTELCFCILVANGSVEKTQKVWSKINKGFLNFSENELRDRLKLFGYRFYNKRANYIISARKHIGELESIFKLEEKEVRKWLAENIKGLGFKEASHFLRNLGYKNFAILDRHVLRILLKFSIIEEMPKTLTKKKYLEIEDKLREIGAGLNISLAELDLYLFYLATGKVCEK